MGEGNSNGGGRRRSWWGWGWEDQALTPDQQENLAQAVAARLGTGDVEVQPPPDLDAIDLPKPRFEPPPALEHICSTDPYDRAGHTYGKSFRDVVRGFSGNLDPAPSFVAFPTTEAEVTAILDWCADNNAPAVPYGGGSSVVAGTELAGAVSIDMTRMDKVLEIDRTSRAARIQAGALGPVLEEQLRPHGYTLRHFPQSFEFSTLGGWLATRSGGHYATNYTHIDEFCESMRVVTPQGVSESRRLPGSGAGPSPDRLFLGSEGTLGIITEAWMRMQDRPIHKATAGVRFATFEAGVQAARAVSQAGLFPTNCRLLDPTEALISAGVTDGSALLVLGFESADHPVDAWMARAVELVQDHGGTLPEGVKTTTATAQDAAGAWKGSFIRAPYTRDALIAMGVVVETFETSITWDRFDNLHATVTEAVTKAINDICGGGWMTCRFTHVYPDGPAPYFSVVAPGRRGSLVSMWDEIKHAASEALISTGGTITHHHAVGRDHRPWYDRQRPDLFAEALRAAKRTLDPAGILNPGVLFDL